MINCFQSCFNFAFNFNLRRYIKEGAAGTAPLEPGTYNVLITINNDDALVGQCRLTPA